MRCSESARGSQRMPSKAAGWITSSPALPWTKPPPALGYTPGLVYYFYPSANCTAATCQLDVGFISSADGGATWSASHQLAGPMSLSWLANTNQGHMVGDYMSTSFSGGPAFPALVSANAPSASVFDEALDTVAGGISVTGGRNSSHGDVVVVMPDTKPIFTPPATDQ